MVASARAIVVVGCTLFVGLMGFLHVVRQDVSPLARGMSRYAGSDKDVQAQADRDPFGRSLVTYSPE